MTGHYLSPRSHLRTKHRQNLDLSPWLLQPELSRGYAGWSLGHVWASGRDADMTAALTARSSQSSGIVD